MKQEEKEKKKRGEKEVGRGKEEGTVPFRVILRMTWFSSVTNRFPVA